MAKTTLLTQQIEKYIKDEVPNKEEWEKFLDAVDSCYERYELDNPLEKQEISSKEVNQTVKKILALSQILHSFFEAASFKDLIAQILKNMCQEFEWDVACCWMPRVENEAEMIVHSLSSSEFLTLNKFIEPGRDLIKPLSEGIENTPGINDLYTTCRLDSEKSIQRKKEATKMGFNSYLLIPLCFKNKVFGIIELFSKKGHLEDQRLLDVFFDIFNEIGVSLGFIIENANNRQKEQQWRVDFAREAGMRQVAMGVLHNVGNVLSSVNVSISELSERVLNSQFNNIIKLAELINLNKGDLTEFITKDPIGSKIPLYIIKLAEWWQNEQKRQSDEFEKLRKDVEHIKSIIQMQQREGSKKNFCKLISFNSFLDEFFTKQNHHYGYDIKFNKEFDELLEIITDENKLLQILTNLVDNAVQAVSGNVNRQKIITLRGAVKGGYVQIEVVDNGCGIDKSDLEKIFTFGFTRKAEGHGYGLCSSYSLARELGGNLSVESAGKDKGATFRLLIPITSDVDSKA